MIRNYYIKKDKEISDGVPELEIEKFPWDENGYRPKTKVALCYSDTALHVRFKVFEESVEIKYRDYCDPVWKDSCVEFFINASPEKGNLYMNFETNAMGVLLLGLGNDRNNRRYLTEVNPEIFGISASVKKVGIMAFKGPFWTIEYSIPFSFLENYFGEMDIKQGTRMTGNFYKCGDDTTFPHYGCWNPISHDHPDFHLPQFFGNLIFD